MEKPEDRSIGMDFRPAQSVRDAAWALAQAVDREHGTNNGKTALYWHLMATVAGHATRQKPNRREPEDTITIGRPDNFHVHFRQGLMLRRVVPWTASIYGRAMVMPNTEDPILTAADAVRYRAAILEAIDEAKAAGWSVGNFTPLMTIKLTHETTPDTIGEARAAGVVAAKMYPTGTTTGSHGGISQFNSPVLIDVLAAMRDCGMVLSVHAEMPDAPVMLAEALFIPLLEDYLAAVPGLKIVVEHVSSMEMVRFVEAGPSNLAATVTPQHLWHTIDDVLAGSPAGRPDLRGLMPHRFCYPVPKTEADRQALWRVLAEGHPRFFAGDDSAPHRRYHKEAECGCAGVFNAPTSLVTYAEVFDRIGDLGLLDGFASTHGAAFYGLPWNPGSLTLRRRTPQMDIPVPPAVVVAGNVPVVVWRGGELTDWVVDEEGR